MSFDRRTRPRGSSNATSDLFRQCCTSSRPSRQPTTLTFSFSVSLSLPSTLRPSLSPPYASHTDLSFSFAPRRSTSSHEQDEELQHPPGGRRLAIIAWTERFTPTSQSGESYKCSPRSSRRRSHLSRDHEAHPRRRCARVECVTPLVYLVSKFFFSSFG